MKRTKSMIYKETTESRELFLYATNDGRLYTQMITPIIKALKKKYNKGIYDTERAVDAYYNAATQASRMYNKDFGYSFAVGDRYTVAVDMEAYYKEEVTYNEK